MKGTLYGVGVGPGDPELMTLKTARLIRENKIIAVPGADPQDTVAYKIAVQAVPEALRKRTSSHLYAYDPRSGRTGTKSCKKNRHWNIIWNREIILFF